MLNHITIMGRLVRDPEYRVASTGDSVVNFVTQLLVYKLPVFSLRRAGKESDVQPDFRSHCAYRLEVLDRKSVV